MNGNGRIQFENRLWKAQGGKCSICLEGLLRDRRFRDSEGWSLDHVYPKSRYKRLGNRGNVLLAHRACNSVKADREPTEAEVELLYAVNAYLGHQLVDDVREYQDPTPVPSPLAVALQQVLAA